MQITVTFRHVDPTPALRAYAEEKLERVARSTSAVRSTRTSS